MALSRYFLHCTAMNMRYKAMQVRPAAPKIKPVHPKKTTTINTVIQTHCACTSVFHPHPPLTQTTLLHCEKRHPQHQLPAMYASFTFLDSSSSAEVSGALTPVTTPVACPV